MNSEVKWHSVARNGTTGSVRPTASFPHELRDETDGEALHCTDSMFYGSWGSWGRGKKLHKYCVANSGSHSSSSAVYPLSFWGVFSRMHYKTFYYKYTQMVVTYVWIPPLRSAMRFPCHVFLDHCIQVRGPGWPVPPFKKCFRTANRWNYT
jgi:hypothetical protein